MQYQTMLYYKGLIEMRKSYSIFTSPTTQILSTEELGSGLLVITFDDGNGGQALAILNPHNTGLPYTLEGQWNLVADAARAGSTVLTTESGPVTVEGISARIYVNDSLAK
jgi:hypothetical protein